MNRRLAGGFTLIEILVAVALMAMLLMALNTFVFSMGEIWGKGAEQRLFDQHVRAVTRHVEKILRAAARSPEAAGGPGAAMREIRGTTGLGNTLLAFDLPAGDRLLVWPGEPLPDVACALGVRPGEGLVLYWHSRLEKNFADQAPRVTVLSSFGTAVSYDYYQPDFKNWRQETSPMRDRDGKWRLPDRLTLQFVHGKMSRQATVTLSAPLDGLPAF